MPHALRRREEFDGREVAVIACLNAALVALALLSLSHAIVALVVSVAMVGGVLWWMKR